MNQYQETLIPSDTAINSFTDKPYFLTQKRITLFSGLLQEKMVNDRPFLKQRYSLRNLADETQIPLYHLSAFLNKVLDVSYPDYINQLRVDYCKHLLFSDACNHYNLRGLAKACGFGNRNTLTTAFLKFTGHTPSDFLKLIRTTGKHHFHLYGFQATVQRETTLQ